jgi:uncharacterized protein (DUF1697 family)
VLRWNETKQKFKNNFSDVLSSIVKFNKPVYLQFEDFFFWNDATKIDFWKLSSDSWPLLENVLSLTTTTQNEEVEEQQQNCNFVVENEVDENSIMLQKNIEKKQNIHLIKEMFFVDFLSDVKDNKKHYFYSTNYKVFETISKIINNSNKNNNDSNGRLNGIDWKKLLHVEDMATKKNISVDKIAPLFNILFPNCSLQSRYKFCILFFYFD